MVAGMGPRLRGNNVQGIATVDAENPPLYFFNGGTIFPYVRPLF